MAQNVSFKPEGFHSATPYLNCKNAAGEIDFLKKAFGATELDRMNMPDGTVMHATVQIGDSRVMIGEASGQMPAMPCAIYLYVQDVDATYRRAVEAGAKGLMEPDTMFWGDRQGGISDPAGNQWFLATQVEVVSAEEIRRRGQEWIQKMTEQRKTA